jgi:hypothetical protein
MMAPIADPGEDLATASTTANSTRSFGIAIVTANLSP